MIITPHSFTRSLVFVMSTLAISGCGSSSRTPAPGAPGFTTVTFLNGNVQFAIPEHYTQRSESDDTIAITPGDDTGIVLRFNLHNLPEAVAEEFLQSQATKKGMQINRIGNKATVSETGTRSEGGRDYDITFWQVGFGDSLVVMSAEVDRKRKDDKSVVECLNRVPKIIESMQTY